jgi:holo-[acyl-carrier protein] synthase
MGSVIGIGIDQEEVTRVARVFATPRGLTRVFTPHEIAYCQPKRRCFEHLAARFAAKEALFKALGTGLSGKLRWTDVEVHNEPSGKPYIILSGAARELADEMGVHAIFVSLSHTRQYAIAQVVLQSA